jgi:hypothetical protein
MRESNFSDLVTETDMSLLLIKYANALSNPWESAAMNRRPDMAGDS